MTKPIGRRSAMLRAGAAAGAMSLSSMARAAGPQSPPRAAESAKEEDVGPGEDLMREHGVLRRILLVYGEVARRLEASAGVDVATVQRSAKLIRRFVEDYHERQEEEMLFPRFERAHRLVELVNVLRVQHQAGRRVTERIQGLATAEGIKSAEGRRRLCAELQSFTRMYEPHAAREDTVLFPALHEIVSRSEYDALGEDFERREHKAFGGDGFEQAVAEVGDIERKLGIEDLAQFTPRV
jgi:hemerythrin-like domain-containing protein